MTSTLDKEYSPSQWSRRFDTGAECIDAHVEFVREHSNRVRSICEHTTVAYGVGPAEQMDVYSCNGAVDPVDVPLCVFVHGGYWQTGSRHDSAFVATHLCAAGYNVCVVGYDLCPRVSLERIVAQIVRAARFVDDYAQKLGSKYEAEVISKFGYTILLSKPMHVRTHETDTSPTSGIRPVHI